MQKDRPAVAGSHLDSGFSIAHSLVILFDGIPWTDPTYPWGERGSFGKREGMGAGEETLAFFKKLKGTSWRSLLAEKGLKSPKGFSEGESIEEEGAYEDHSVGYSATAIPGAVQRV
jgi:hypothetical protein